MCYGVTVRLKNLSLAHLEAHFFFSFSSLYSGIQAGLICMHKAVSSSLISCAMRMNFCDLWLQLLKYGLRGPALCRWLPWSRSCRKYNGAGAGSSVSYNADPLRGLLPTAWNVFPWAPELGLLWAVIRKDADRPYNLAFCNLLLALIVKAPSSDSWAHGAECFPWLCKGAWPLISKWHAFWLLPYHPEGDIQCIFFFFFPVYWLKSGTKVSRKGFHCL